ncbi:MAG: hypothetical protein NVSMB19_01780 [Vulcanimicrobiaceae bacterium]
MRWRGRDGRSDHNRDPGRGLPKGRTDGDRCRFATAEQRRAGIPDGDGDSCRAVDSCAGRTARTDGVGYALTRRRNAGPRSVVLPVVRRTDGDAACRNGRAEYRVTGYRRADDRRADDGRAEHRRAEHRRADDRRAAVAEPLADTERGARRYHRALGRPARLVHNEGIGRQSTILAKRRVPNVVRSEEWTIRISPRSLNASWCSTEPWAPS